MVQFIILTKISQAAQSVRCQLGYGLECGASDLHPSATAIGPTLGRNQPTTQQEVGGGRISSVLKRTRCKAKPSPPRSTHI